MQAVLELVLVVLRIYYWVVIAMIILSWLISFNVVNTRNQFVSQVWRILTAVTDPVLRPIRRIMPNFNGLDISPIILFLLIFFLERIILLYLMPMVIGR